VFCFRIFFHSMLASKFTRENVWNEELNRWRIFVMVNSTSYLRVVKVLVILTIGLNYHFWKSEWNHFLSSPFGALVEPSKQPSSWEDSFSKLYPQNFNILFVFFWTFGSLFAVKCAVSIKLLVRKSEQLGGKIKAGPPLEGEEELHHALRNGGALQKSRGFSWSIASSLDHRLKPQRRGSVEFASDVHIGANGWAR